jgi:hypothetical protein
LPPASVDSEWAAAAMLRTGWATSCPWLAVLYPGPDVMTELNTAQGVLWSGAWEIEVHGDGKPLAPSGEWEEVCWISDDDVDYLELEADWTGGVRVQRQMLLARNDGFLFLADAILGRESANFEYRGRLPLAEGVVFEGAKETFEGVLVKGKKPAALVLPIALPEWRVAPRIGTLAQNRGALELAQSGRGRCLYAPLYLDLQARRMKRPATWRQLTVGENLAIEPTDVAVGYRVMIDRRQWLIYRALASKGNRTLLGHNLATEMLVARFGKDGEVEPLLEIE